MYYQTRRILKEMGVPIPPKNSCMEPNRYTYNRMAYTRICDEFNVSYDTNWKVAGPNNGLRQVYFYVTNVWYMTVYGNADPDHFDPSKMSFTGSTTNDLLHVYFIKQNSDNTNTAWSFFILNKSQCFTYQGYPVGIGYE